MFFSFVLFMLGMAYFESQGKESAFNVLNNIKEKKYSMVRIDPKNKSKQFALLYCGARSCAALNTKNKEIVYFPQKGHSYLAYKKI
ncbi:MAG: hypothetical protein QNK36_11825 [Colwellia sp.]|nr:hypothetical protein [Colwellia sp.]